jgi:hypothetical protein
LARTKNISPGLRPHRTRARRPVEPHQRTRRRAARDLAEREAAEHRLGGDGDVIADIYRERVTRRGKGSEVWGWGTAYGAPK